jgi:hypothetical protein
MIFFNFWEPQTPGTLEARPGLYMKSFTFYIIQKSCTSCEINKVT